MIVDVPGIPLRRRDGSVEYALVDAEDFLWLNEWRWNMAVGGRYVTRYQPGHPRRVLMHRQIMGLSPGDGLEVDHINGNGLDNRRANLRVVTHAQNGQNHGSHRDARSRHRGVSWDSRRGRWLATVTIRGRRIHGGQFVDENEAAQAAAALRAEHMPFAVERDAA